MLQEEQLKPQFLSLGIFPKERQLCNSQLSFFQIPHPHPRSLFPIFLKFWLNLYYVRFAVSIILRVHFRVISCIQNNAQPSPLFSKLKNSWGPFTLCLSSFNIFLVHLEFNFSSSTWPMMASCQAPTCLLGMDFIIILARSSLTGLQPC